MCPLYHTCIGMSRVVSHAPTKNKVQVQAKISSPPPPTQSKSYMDWKFPLSLSTFLEMA
jgi:hypothetical protein